MRQLMAGEIQAIAGGDIAASTLNCISPDTWANVEKKARHDALVFSGVTTLLSTSVVWGATKSIPGTGIAAIGLAPYLAIVGYFNSNAWNIFK